MKNIELRAYDKINKRMGYFESGFAWLDEYDSWVLTPKGESITDVPPYEDSIILMESICQTDVAGDLIFDGDILKNDEFLWLVVYDENGSRFILEQIIKKKKFDGRIGNLRLPIQRYFIQKFKRIGNVYENPELLKL